MYATTEFYSIQGIRSVRQTGAGRRSTVDNSLATIDVP